MTQESKLVVTLIEVIEHIIEEKHSGLLDNLHQLQPDVIVFTTPNREFNKFFNLEQGKFRHWDHKFEFDTKEFVAFCNTVALDVYNYSMISIPFPDIDRLVKQYKHARADIEGITATFMAVFTLK